MSVASDLIAALSSLKLPVAQNVYTGTAKTYIVFNFNDIPFFHTDDDADSEKHLIQVHLFCEHTTNPTTTISDIKTALKTAGYPLPSCTNASDDDGQHYVMETESVTVVSDGSH